MHAKNLVARAGVTLRENRSVEFKREFNSLDVAAKLELIKDIVAIANSGGGIIVFGVEDNGLLSDGDCAELMKLDLADLTNLIAKYTAYQFHEMELVQVARHGAERPAFLISALDIPLIFVKPGTYAVGEKTQKTAFSQGTVYFRHGAKSEPGRREDLAEWLSRALSSARRGWLGNIRKVVSAPYDATFTANNSTPMGVIHVEQISSDAKATKIIPGNAHEIFPYRQKELILTVNGRLTEKRINTHDITCLNQLEEVHQNPKFSYRAHPLSSALYSDAYVDWIVEKISTSKDFLEQARDKYRDRMKLQRPSQKRKPARAPLSD